MGIQRHHATIDEGGVLFSGVGVPQSMEGNASVRCSGVADSITVAEDELLNVIELIAVIMGGLKGEDEDGK